MKMWMKAGSKRQKCPRRWVLWVNRCPVGSDDKNAKSPSVRMGSSRGDPTLPSALRRFTSEFGMGSGGTTALVPPGKFFVLSTQFFIASAALPVLAKSVTYLSMLLPFLRLSPCYCANYCVLNSESKLKLLRQNIFGVVRLSLTVH